MKSVLVLLGGFGAVVLMVLSLGAWQGALRLIQDHADVSRPEVAVWAVRCGCIAAAALAQELILLMVIAPLYRRQVFDRVLRWGAGITMAGAVVSAAAFAMAAQ